MDGRAGIAARQKFASNRTAYIRNVIGDPKCNTMRRTVRNIRNRRLTREQIDEMPGLLEGLRYRTALTYRNQEDRERRTQIIAGSAITIGVLASAIAVYYLFGDKSKSD